MRKKFYIDKGFLLGWLTMILVSILSITVYFILEIIDVNDRTYLNIGILIASCSLLVMIRAFNWVTIDHKGVYAKSLFGLIKFCSWESIKYIEIVVTLEGSRHTGRFYILFTEDSIGEEYTLTFNRKRLNIRVPFCKETTELIKKYYNGEIIGLPYEEIVKRRKK